jgi:formylglycine-generating enzyme required for sulfatase activity/energy-coupling factor transporter ATP-binding protein EcfA2
VTVPATSQKAPRKNPGGQQIIASEGASIAHVQQTIVHGDLYAFAAAASPDLALLFARYRAFVAENFGALDFRGVMQIQAATRISLEQIYIPVKARSHQTPAGDTPTVASLHDFVAAHRLLVVLGDPGSGKSTLVRYLLLALTRGTMGDLKLGPAYLPIFFPVAAFAAARQARADLAPLAYLSEYYQGLSQPDYGPLFQRALAHGRALLLLDGLDEVRDDRRGIAHALDAFTREWEGAGNRFIATARAVGYDDAPLDARRFATVTIQPLDVTQIYGFIERWSRAYATLGEPVAPASGDLLGDLVRSASASEFERRVAAHAASLAEAVFHEPHVTDLARNPLLLTVLALIHNQGARLPDRRVDLYRLCVEALAETWNRARSLSGRPVDVQLGDEQMDERFVVNILGPVALWIHGERAGGLVEQDDLERQIAATLERTDGLPKRRARRLAKEFIDLMRRDTGLLQERGYRRFAFLHLTFEEYLAARGLLESVAVAEPEQVLRRCVLDPRWREVVRLAVAAASQREAQRLLLSILATPATGDDYGTPVVLAGECLLDVGRNGATGRAWSAVVGALLALLDDGAAPAGTRAAAGAVLGRLGDPRRLDLSTGRAEGAEELPVPDYWCDVAAGAFWVSAEGRRVPAGLRRAELPYAFRIARYPVTNLEFARFIAAGGYADSRWWSREGWRFIGPQGQRPSPDERGALIVQPGLWGSPAYSSPGQPVVALSWYEAAAYCAWLTAEGRAAGWLYEGEVLRLPTALEWERVARHTDQRTYPWGEETPDATRANFDAVALRAPSAVGCFPAGAAVSGALDMAGNVWEWTATSADSMDALAPRPDQPAGERVAVKGGAFNAPPESLRCGAHYWFHPAQRYNLLGFRVVWAAEGGAR